MTYELKMRVTADRYFVESLQLRYRREDPANVVTADFHGSERVFCIGDCSDNAVSKNDPADPMAELITPDLNDPFSGETFSSSIACQAIFHYINKALENKRTSRTGILSKLLFSQMDKIDIELEIDNSQGANQNQCSELLKVRRDYRIVGNVTIKTADNHFLDSRTVLATALEPLALFRKRKRILGAVSLAVGVFGMLLFKSSGHGNILNSIFLSFLVGNLIVFVMFIWTWRCPVCGGGIKIDGKTCEKCGREFK